MLKWDVFSEMRIWDHSGVKIQVNVREFPNPRAKAVLRSSLADVK